MTTAPLPPLTYLDGAEVALICADLPVVDLVHDTLLAFHRGEAGLAPETALHWTTRAGDSARSLILPGWSGDSYGCKIINASLGNHRFGLPRAAGLIVLNDPVTAQPVCVMEGGRISALRTAGVTVAAVRAVRELSQIDGVAFLGCGRQARVHLELLTAACRGLNEVVLHDREAARAEALATEIRESRPDIKVTVAPRAQDAVGSAKLTVAVTTTTKPYVELDWVPSGGVFVNVSLDDSAESLLIGCDRLFVDNWDLVARDDRRLLGALARRGRISGPGKPAPSGGRAVDADLPTLLSGDIEWPMSDKERVVINPFGMGVHDIVVAAAVYARAGELKAGLTLTR